jgi:hypothetical protein
VAQDDFSWRGTEIKSAVAAMFVLFLTFPIWGPPIIRASGIAGLLGWNLPDAGWWQWYQPTTGEEDLPAVTGRIFAQDGLVVPFEILSVLLLAALVAGVVIAFRDPESEA